MNNFIKYFIHFYLHISRIFPNISCGCPWGCFNPRTVLRQVHLLGNVIAEDIFPCFFSFRLDWVLKLAKFQKLYTTHKYIYRERILGIIIFHFSLQTHINVMILRLDLRKSFLFFFLYKWN